MRALWLATSALVVTSSAGAQQTQETPPKTARQTVLEKLRNMGQEAPRDTSTLPDSVRERLRRQRADSANLARRPQQQATAPVELPRDSLMQALARLQGFTMTEYKGTSARFNADSGILILHARPDSQAAVVQGAQSMTADSLLTFNRGTAIACGYGKPVLTGERAEAPVQSTLVCYNTKTRVGTALGATTRVTEGANWIVAGDLTTADADLYIHDGRFTDCALEIPHYHFSAGEVKVVNKDVLVARNVTLNFGDVPVFWLPFLMQSLKQGRRSGILMPEFSVNDIVRRSSRYNRRITNLGFYWAASEYVGARLAFGWFNDNWTQLDGSFDYRVSEKFLDGGVNWRQYWPAGGGRQMTLSATNSWQPNERTSLNGNVAYASSSQFLKQNTFDPRELNRSIDSNVNMRRQFDWGSVSLGGSRRQHLSDNRVDLVLPSLGVSFSSVTLFPSAGGTRRWYNDATWTGNASTRLASARLDQLTTPTGFDTDALQVSAQSGFTLGQFSLSQSVSMDRNARLERAAGLDQEGDSIRFAPSVMDQRMNWNTALSFQQRLMGTSTFTPGIALRGESARDTLTGMTVTAPTRLDANASLKVDVFGFWRGIGPVERIRHHLSPTISYSYSPASAPDSSQARVFGRAQIREQNRVTLGLSQTIEGKYRSKASPADSVSAPDTISNDPEQPRRLPQGNRVRLLSLNTDAVVYDFVEAREGFGVQTTQISNSINSDLLRGLQLSVTHDLFRALPLPEGAPPETRPDRKFAPHLSAVSASFSLNGSSWLFRTLGLGGGSEAPPAPGPTPTPGPEQTQPGAVVPNPGSNLGLLGSRSQPTAAQTPRGAVGSWNASFNYTLFRPRQNQIGGQENQMVTAHLTFQPTENWNVTWNTGYSFTATEFTDHVLTLTRAMHDWDANFDFVKAQNGNFSFQFRVALRANSDIKFDYQQRDNTRAGLPR